ncbi:Oidioi.mRNA.OKI2018_I69.YSR.g17075.t1.cds [Oikopleura dioica]|uniref:Oidioi.mRNA.OKI2018_I69.YSR.g17075.t1.cds n=1 Tax=Oikopleura dioica TaxID=34765 RepID=A0ABN7SLW6_OIKDI|nr:Oidioi.mRNA.OKI2018_I69.YSR.g17075.t1.cds [Oikopleura dioica]
MSTGFAPLRGENKKDSNRLSLKAELTESPISESDHQKIQADLQKDDRYCFLLSEIEDDRERKVMIPESEIYIFQETIIEEMKANLKKLAVLHAKRKSLDDIKGALRRGENLHHDDQLIWDEGEANILAEYEATKQEDKNSDKKRSRSPA